MNLEFTSDYNNVPAWHIPIVKERIKSYQGDAEQVLDFDDAMDDIEASLDLLSGSNETEKS